MGTRALFSSCGKVKLDGGAHVRGVEFHAAARRHGVARVGRELYQRELKALRVGRHFGEIRGELQLYANGVAERSLDQGRELNQQPIEIERRTAEAGFDHHPIKPVDPQMLNALLAEAAKK